MEPHNAMEPAKSEPHFLIVGLTAAIVIVAFALGLSSAFAPETYTSWVAFVGLTAVPAQLVIALLWHFEHPAFLKNLAQPAKGIAFLVLSAVAMAAGGAFLYFVPGKGAGLTPMLINAAIMSVVGAFWVVEVWRAWPLSAVIRGGFVLGAAAWILSYAVGYGAYELLFSFAAASHAPFYKAALDPAGLFDAWDALVFCVATTSVIVIFEKIFEMWPFADWPRTSEGLLRGLVKTVVVLILSIALVEICLRHAHFERVDFMVRVPIALIFGVFLVTNLTQSRLFASVRQPIKGILLLVFVVVLGAAMEEFYRAIAPALVREALPPGPPEYKIELWVATALLSVTFPIIIVVTGYFDLWPFKRRRASRSGI